MPWIVTAILQSATPGTEPRHNPLFSATLIVGLGVVCLTALIVVWGTWVMVPPDQAAGGLGTVDEPRRSDSFDRVADPVRDRDGRLELSEPMLEPRQGVRVQVELQDILALVVGYGMAALLFRAFWRTHPPWLALGLPGAALYLWLGLAMSGPIIMLRRRLSRRGTAASDDVASSNGAESPRPAQGSDPSRAGAAGGISAGGSAMTWAERAWLLIGAYWIVLGIFVIPARLHEFKLGDVVLFGLAPVVAAIGLQFLGPAPAWARCGPALDACRRDCAPGNLAPSMDLLDCSGELDALDQAMLHRHQTFL